MKMMSNKGDNGSPCFTPSAISKKLDTSDCISSAANTLPYRDCNIRVKELTPFSKPKSLMYDRIKRIFIINECKV